MRRRRTHLRTGRMPDPVSRPAIFLFGIDGTLITSGGAAGRALGNIFILRYGRNPFVGMKFAGGTDYAFFRRALEILGEPWSKALIDSLFADYLGVRAPASGRV